MTIATTLWQNPPNSVPQLLPGQIHLWRFSLDVLPEVYQDQQSLLSGDELARADRLLDPEKQRNFTIARSRLRQLLGRYLDLVPDKVELSYNKFGKPFIAALNSGKLAFNLSHSGSMALFAVTIDGEIGVDIEKVDPDLNFQSLANRYFTPLEIVKLRGFPAIRQRRKFYRIWTCKEAVLKMIGSGFSSPAPFGLLSQNCSLENMFFAAGYVSAVAINTKITSVHKFVLPADGGITTV